jgi:hypothetical protein
VNTRVYARRQLNPFDGVLQVFESDCARAFSANGVVWQIQTLASRPDHTWRSPGEQPPVQQFFNWGQWSPQQGLSQVIANPILDIGAMEIAANSLIDALEPRLALLPFSLADMYELWACDHQGMPIALLDSALTEKATGDADGTDWQAGPDFACPTLSDAGTPNASPDSTRPHADFLERQVRGRTHARRWFLRQPDGCGTSLDRAQPLPAQAFPELGISEHWDDPLAQGAFDDFIAARAPLLLTLELSPHRREQLEQQASRNAVLVDDLHRLYPATIDHQLIEQIRVQARLLRSQ